MIFREPLKEEHPQLQTPLHFLYQCGGIFAFISGRTEGSFLSEKVLRGRHGSVLLVVEGVSGPVDGVSDSVKPLGVVCTMCVCVCVCCSRVPVGGWMCPRVHFALGKCGSLGDSLALKAAALLGR